MTDRVIGMDFAKVEAKVLAVTIAEIVGPSGRVHYRRPVNDPLVAEASKTPGYTVRFVERETVEPVRSRK